MEPTKTKSKNPEQGTAQSSGVGFFSLFSTITKVDVERLISIHNSLIPRVFRISLVFGSILFVFGFVLVAYKQVAETIPEWNPVLRQINALQGGHLVAILTSEDSTENKALRYDPQSQSWRQRNLSKKVVYNDWISVSPDTNEMLKMESNESGDITFSYLNEDLNNWQEIYKVNESRPQEVGFNFIDTRLFYDFKFDWERRFGFFGLSDLGYQQKRRFAYKEDTSFHRYSKFTLDGNGQIQVSGFDELDEMSPVRIVDGWVLGKNQTNTFWKYDISGNIETRSSILGTNNSFQFVSTPYAIYVFGGAIVRHDYVQNQPPTILSLPYSTSSTDRILLVKEDSTGNLLIAANSGVFYSRDQRNTWTTVRLPEDSLVIKEMAFNWETQEGALIVYKNGYDQIYTCSGNVNTWNHVPLIIESSDLPFQTIEAAIWVFGSLDVLMLLFLFVRARQIRKEVIRVTNESVETPLSLRSDNPVDEDTLGIFTSSKNALAKLIANESTQPPVSIAINGGWGSGKSSLMKMLRRDLKESGNANYVTIWFNVWHFESEEHLLAVFLSKMIERFNTDLGLGFRIRLFVNRIRRLSFNSKFRFFFFIFMITPPILYFLNSLVFRRITLDLNSIKFFEKLFSGVRAFLIQGTSIENWGSHLWLPVTGGLLLVAIFTGIFNMSKAWTPTGLSALMQLFPLDELKKESHEKNPGYRDKYKKEFWRLLESVGKNTKIVVFVDDLDRVTGDKIKQLLEGINFISDTASKPDDIDDATANMYFIIGMALKEVVKNLEGELTRDDKFTTEGEKVSLGLRFIEKMIDLTVQIPPISSASDEKLQSLVSMENGE